VPTKLQADASLQLPPANYSAGATVFAAFVTSDDPKVFEVYVAAGRPGEPLGSRGLHQPPPGPPRPPGSGVGVDRYTTRDFVTYSPSVTVLFLPDGGPAGGPAEVGLGDGAIWTVKSVRASPSPPVACAPLCTDCRELLRLRWTGTTTATC
jgi:hypothetical protein